MYKTCFFFLYFYLRIPTKRNTYKFSLLSFLSIKKHKFSPTSNATGGALAFNVFQ